MIKRHQALSLGGHVKEADSLLAQWVTAHPNDAEAGLYLARTYSARGNRRQAINQYQALLRVVLNQIAALNNLALLYLEASESRARPTAERRTASRLATRKFSTRLGGSSCSKAKPKRVPKSFSRLQL